MRTAVCGVWHVHAPEYTQRALELGQVVGFYEPDDSMAAGVPAEVKHKL